MLTAVSVVDQLHTVNEPIVVEFEIRISCSDSWVWMDVNWRLLLAAALWEFKRPCIRILLITGSFIRIHLGIFVIYIYTFELTSSLPLWLQDGLAACMIHENEHNAMVKIVIVIRQWNNEKKVIMHYCLISFDLPI